MSNEEGARAFGPDRLLLKADDLAGFDVVRGEGGEARCPKFILYIS